MASGAELAMILRAKDEASGVFDRVKGAAGGVGSAVGSMMSGLGGIGMAAGGVMAIGQAIGGLATSMVSGNAQMETFQTQLGTMMGSADAAKERIAQLAKIGAETPFELPQLVAAEKIMMGFGLNTDKTMKLTGKSLDQYRTSMGDMAAGTGTDLSEITNLWAKFGSGATGESLARLQELGIVTKEQLAGMGIEFSKSGELISPLPKAMTAAMQIANEKFGGGMKALSSTFEGQMSTLSDNFNQAKTVLMQPIFEVLKTGLTGLNEVLSSETFTSSIQAMAETGAAAIQTLIEAGRALFEIFQGGEDAGEAGEFLATLFPVDVANGIIETMISLGATFQNIMAGDIPGAIAAATSVLTGFGQIIVGAVESWASAFVSWFPGVQQGYGQMLGDIATGLIDWILTSAVSIVEQLGVWAAAFLDWIGPMIPPFLREMGVYMSEMLGYLGGTALPMIVGKLAEWGQAFVAWIGPRIGPILAELGGLLVELGGWLLGTALPAIVSKLAEWGLAFLNWIGTDVLPALPGKLGEILSSIGGWIGGAAGELVGMAGQLGRSIIDGVVQAIRNGVSSIQGAVIDVIRRGLAAGQADNESHSPSQKWARELGRPLLEGVMQPFLDGGSEFNRAVVGLTQPPTLRPALAGPGAGFGGGGFGGGGSQEFVIDVRHDDVSCERIVIRGERMRARRVRQDRR